MVELNERMMKTKSEIDENQRNPERIATMRGQNIQNLENTKKRAEELESDLNEAEKKFNLINKNLQGIQEKLSVLRENKARNEATVEGIDQRKKDLSHSMKNELNLENENNLLSISDVNALEKNQYPVSYTHLTLPTILLV